jgi:hypothetical protein
MNNDWKSLSTDQLLNFEGTNEALSARYGRVMQQRSIEAVSSLTQKTNELVTTIDRNSQSQSRQQSILIVLSIVVAVSTIVYTWITWQSVAAMREANEIQRQSLQFQKQQHEKRSSS